MLTSRKNVKAALQSTLPMDSDELTAIIESVPILSDSAELHHIVRQSPTVRKAHLVSDSAKTDYKLLKPTQKLSAVAHLRRFEAEQPCTRCRIDGGPYAECILLNGHLGGGCTNCFYNRGNHAQALKCSHATRERKEAAHAISITFIRRAKLPAQITISKSSILDQTKHQSTGETILPTLPNIPGDVASTISSSFRLMGNLRLPQPSQAGLPEGIVQLAFQFQHHLDILSKRDLRGLSGRIDLRSEFKQFQKHEAIAWKSSSQTPREKSAFVRPSGSTDSAIAHHLNQPSWTTATLGSEEETADKSNHCIAMVMGNAFRPETLIYGHVHRRSSTSEDITQYPSPVLQAHEDFTKRIMASSAAKVEIVYGAKVQTRIIQEFRPLLLPLWDEYQGIILGLIPEYIFHNAEHGFEYRKVVLFAAHPMHLFFQKANNRTLQQQDYIVRVAVLKADPQLEYNEMFYRSRAFVSLGEGVWERAQQAAQNLSRKSALNLSGAFAPKLEDTVKSENMQNTWESFFDPISHSNNTMRQLIPDTITSIEQYHAEIDWIHPSEFPNPLLRWFKGMKQVIFSDSTVYGPADAISAIQKCLSPSKQIRKSTQSSKSTGSLRNSMYQLLHKQQKELNRPVRIRKTDDLVHCRFDGTSIESKCPCGHTLLIDDSPQFSCRRPGAYVRRQSRKCHSKNCQGNVLDFIPVQEGLNFVGTSRANLISYAPRTRPFEDRPEIIACLKKPSANSKLPVAVEIWCMRCKEQTDVKRKAGSYLDESPLFTIGVTRHLYVEKFMYCLRCERLRDGRTSRFVPKDPTTASILRQTFSKFAVRFEQYDLVVKTQLLQNWPASSREPRVDESDHLDELDADADGNSRSMDNNLMIVEWALG